MITCEACKELPIEDEAEEPQSFRTFKFNKSHLMAGMWGLESSLHRREENKTQHTMSSTHGLHDSKIISAQLLKESDANVEQNKEKVTQFASSFCRGKF